MGAIKSTLTPFLTAMRADSNFVCNTCNFAGDDEVLRWGSVTAEVLKRNGVRVDLCCRWVLQKKDGRRSGARRQRRNKSTLTPFLHLAALLALLFASPSFASYGPDRLANPALEARAVALQKELRCVVCQSQSLDESDAPLAEDLRRLIRAHIAKGESDDRIKNYLVARYGDFILMNPPVEPDTYGLWFGPFIVLAIGGGGAAAVIARAHRRAKAQDAPAKDRALRQANGDREA